MQPYLRLTLIAGIAFVSCRKQVSNPTRGASLVDSAQTWFENSVTSSTKTALSASGNHNARFSSSRNLQWQAASVLQSGKTSIVSVPVGYNKGMYVNSTIDNRGAYELSGTSRLIVYRDSAGNFVSSLVLYLPDSNYLPGKNFSGLMVATDWQGNPLARYIVNKDGGVLKQTEPANLIHSTTQSNGVTTNVVITETCYEIYGYNYSVADPDGGVYWDEGAVCTYGISAELTGGSLAVKTGSVYGAAGKTVGAPQTIMIRPATSVIASIQDYIKCFTNVAGSGNSYSVTVCVDQPMPGTRQAWGLVSVPGAAASSGNNPVDVGHTFLILTQHTGSTTITRNIGFYPAQSVNPLSPSSPGKVSDDESHAYDVSLTVTVTNSQFFNMLNYVAANASDTYNLSNLNCTTFALQTLWAGAVNVSSQKGTWPNGGGYDPGDMGQDIRTMALSTNESRNTVYNLHANTGTCN